MLTAKTVEEYRFAPGRKLINRVVDLNLMPTGKGRYLWKLLVFSLLIWGGTPEQGIRAETSLLQKAEKQLSEKKYKLAARTLTKAMNSGSLSGAEMTRALYRRGIAYNGSGRYSSAIADLTGALWLGKLDDSGRKDAYRQRARAYEATGYKKQARQDLGRAGKTGSSIVVSSKKAGQNVPLPPIPTFKTVVRAAAKKTPSTASAPVSAKAASVKPATSRTIPAFRTSITTK